MDRSDLASRMKLYENVPRRYLMRRAPVIIRIDGRSFHTFTRGFKRPFDEILIESMQETMKYLCENIQGCVLGYCQSDEISLVLIDYKELDTSPWFDYRVDKVCSIAASMATLAFNKYFSEKAHEFVWNNEDNDEHIWYCEALAKSMKSGAMFDARCFNLPKEEVTNCIYWRQLDATRNSIQMVGQANFSHSELHQKTCNMIQDILMTQKGINWNDFPTYLKRGSCCIKGSDSKWVIDKEIPIFKGEGREYIEKLINFD